MQPLPVVEHLDVLEDISPCLIPSTILPMVDKLLLQRADATLRSPDESGRSTRETFHRGIVPAVRFPAHAPPHGRLKVCVRTLDFLAELEGLTVEVELYNSFDRITFHPAKLVKTTEAGGDVLKAVLELESEPAVPISRTQLKELNAHIKISR